MENSKTSEIAHCGEKSNPPSPWIYSATSANHFPNWLIWWKRFSVIFIICTFSNLFVSLDILWLIWFFFFSQHRLDFVKIIGHKWWPLIFDIQLIDAFCINFQRLWKLDNENFSCISIEHLLCSGKRALPNIATLVFRNCDGPSCAEAGIAQV